MSGSIQALVRSNQGDALRQSYNAHLRSIQETKLETGLRTGLLYAHLQHNSENESPSLSLKIDPQAEGAPFGALRVKS